jgi:RNA polymerase sigma-70 factor (ECF subfamily)
MKFHNLIERLNPHQRKGRCLRCTCHAPELCAVSPEFMPKHTIKCATYPFLQAVSRHIRVGLALDHFTARSSPLTGTLIWPVSKIGHRDLNVKDAPLIKHVAASGNKNERIASNSDWRRASFEAVALPHLDAAYSLARWLTRNDADAGDVVQEAFMRAFRYFDSYRGGNAKSWVLKIVRQTCYDWLARNRPADVVSLDAEVEFRGEFATASINNEALLESRSDLRRVERLIGALPAALRETIVLREVHEFSYREIAEVTGVPIGTVMSRLYSARAELLRADVGTAPRGRLRAKAS